MKNQKLTHELIQALPGSGMGFWLFPDCKADGPSVRPIRVCDGAEGALKTIRWNPIREMK